MPHRIQSILQGGAAIALSFVAVLALSGLLIHATA